MKPIKFLIVMICIVAMACKDSSTQKEQPAKNATNDTTVADPVAAVKQISFASMKEISEATAIAMIKAAKKPKKTRHNTVATFSYDDFSKIAKLLKIDAIKMVRTNFLKDYPDNNKKNQPTIICAVFYSALPTQSGAAAIQPGVLYYEATTVCPPPDGSTCWSSLNLPEETTY